MSKLPTMINTIAMMTVVLLCVEALLSFSDTGTGVGDTTVDSPESAGSGEISDSESTSDITGAGSSPSLVYIMEISSI